MNLFSLKDYEIESLLSKYGNVNKNYKEYPYVYLFPDLHIVFWRPISPSKLKNDMKLDLQDMDETSEEYQEINEYYTESLNKYSYFQTVAIFEKGYYEYEKEIGRENE